MINLHTYIYIEMIMKLKMNSFLLSSLLLPVLLCVCRSLSLIPSLSLFLSLSLSLSLSLIPFLSLYISHSLFFQVGQTSWSQSYYACHGDRDGEGRHDRGDDRWYDVFHGSKWWLQPWDWKYLLIYICFLSLFLFWRSLFPTSFLSFFLSFIFSLDKSFSFFPSLSIWMLLSIMTLSHSLIYLSLSNSISLPLPQIIFHWSAGRPSRRSRSRGW